jgi:hypothetical protein
MAPMLSDSSRKTRTAWRAISAASAFALPARSRVDSGYIDKAILDHAGLLAQPHDLVAMRLVAGDPLGPIGDRFLDQLSTRDLVLDHLIAASVRAGQKRVWSSR